jgi:hypothetical protein
MFSLRTALALAVAGSAVIGVPAKADDEAQPPHLRVIYDQNTLLRLDRPAKTVIVGNPSIADVQFVDPRTVYVVGRMFGNTNLIAIDADGGEVLNAQVTVTGADASQVTLYRGPNGQRNLACAPQCERTMTQGDPDMETMVQNYEKKSGAAEKAASLGR